MICQELRCKKQESEDHVGTLCKFHAEKLEKWQSQRGTEYDPFEYKKINGESKWNKNKCVWENGIENVRAIQIPMINNWIKNKESKKKTFQEMADIINAEIEKIDGKLEEYEKMKNMRYSK